MKRALWGQGLVTHRYLGRVLGLRRNDWVYEIEIALGRLDLRILWRRKQK